MEAISFLCMAGVEAVNSNRTLSYLARGLGGSRFDVPRRATSDGGYEDIYEDIYGPDSSYSSGLACYCPALDDDTNFVDPESDPAPWYESSRPESADFLGIVTDQLSIENPPLRSVAALSHGGLVGRLQRRSRLIVVHGQMFAASSRGMAWGERWLTEVLTGTLCEDCGGDSAEVIPACPDPDGSDSGIRTLYDVGIVDGPIFTPVQGVPGCHVQEVAFQIVAGNPYLHHEPVTSSVTVGSAQTLATIVETEEWGGDAAVSVQIEAATALTNVVITATPVVDTDDCPNVNANPCVRYDIASVPKGHVLTVDAIRRKVTEYNDSLKSEQSGYRRLAFSGPFEWIEVPPCSLMCVAVAVGGGTADVEIASAVREI